MNVEDTPITPFQDGVDQANAEAAENPEDEARRVQERARVRQLLTRIEEGRKFDQAAYEAMAKDRLYARGITGSAIKVNLIQSYIDTWVSVLYARDPDVDVLPADAVSQRTREEARLFAKTLEVVIVKLWKRGKLKRKAIKWVRAALTVGIGWLRVTWQQRTAHDPIIKGQIDDIQDNLRALVALREQMEEPAALEAHDAQKVEEEERLSALEANVEKIISRQLCFDFIRSEDIVVSNDVETIMDYQDGSWLDIRTFKSFDQACALFPDVPRDKMKSATMYGRRSILPDAEQPKPGTTKQSADEASIYASAAYDAVNNSDCSGMFVCIHETQDRDTGLDYTLIEGLDCFPRPPVARKPYATRFYDVFALSFTEVDGLRYPQSLNTRSHSLQDEYTNLESRLSTHRRRIIPKIIFNKAKVDNKGAKAMAIATTGEMVGIDVRGNIDMSKLLYVPQYPALDPGLYSTENIKHNMEIVWGTQEAVMGSVTVAKTATEAKIQEAGTGARTTSKRDTLDDSLSDIAQFTAEIAIQVLDTNDARNIAGPDALWPEISKPEDLDAFVQVEIRAGSSGKPDTAMQIEQWTQELPLLSQGIKEIAALRRSDPLDVANCMEALIEETVERFGDRIDLARLIPQLPELVLDPMTGMMTPKHMVSAPPAPALGPDGQPLPPTEGGAPAGAEVPGAGGEPVPGMSGPVGPENVNPMVP